MQRKTLLFTSLLLINYYLNAQNGLLDPSFNSTGKVNLNLGPVSGTGGSERAIAASLQADGKLVMLVANSGTHAVIRYNTDGTIDNTFDNDGIVGLYGMYNSYAMKIHTDGKIVVAGFLNINSNDFAVIRLNANGSYDNTFDGDGRVTTSIGTGAEIAYAVAVQPDGKIIAGGYSSNGANNDFALVRYNVNGSLDNTFDGDGKVTTNWVAGNDQINSLAIQADGKIVAAGHAFIASQDPAIARYNADGSIDLTFDGDGKQTSPISVGADQFTSVLIQPDGKIVGAGNGNPISTADMLVMRFNTNGSFDFSFDGDGIVTTATGLGNDYIGSIAIQPDGKLVAAGYYQPSTTGQYDAITVRYNTNGSLDNTFDGDGKKIVAYGASDDYLLGVVIQSNGQIMPVGWSWGSNQDYLIARYNSDGTTDNTFDSDGFLTGFYGGSADNITSVAVQSNGKVLVAGATTNTTFDFAIARFNLDGTPDNTFDGDGRLSTPLGASTDQIQAMALQADGKIVVAGYTNNGTDNDIAVARYNTDGSLDNTFSGDGWLTTQASASSDIANAIAIQPDGKILVAGYTQPSTADIVVVRYNADGTLDNTFDGDGIVITTVGTSTDIANGIKVQADGKIVVAGYTFNGSNNDFVVVRYNANGSLDVAFDGDGKVMTAISTSHDMATGLVIQPDGKIVVGGYQQVGANQDFLAVRYNTNGALDATFDGDGIALTSIGSFNEQPYAIDLQSDGKIVLAGVTGDGISNNMAVLRYNTNGSLDNTFGTGGYSVVDFTPGLNDQANAVKVSGNRIYLGGSVNTELGQDFAIASVTSGLAPLPLELLSFSGNIDNGAAHLIWETTNERNTLEFVIERSVDGVQYVETGTVASVNSPGNHTYTFTDANIGNPDAKKIYYRLKQKDIDGQFTYSGIVTLSLAVNAGIVRLLPNPVEGVANLMITATEREAITYMIIDSKGSIVRTVKTALQPGSNRITINMADLRSGAYTLDVRGVVTNEQLRFLKR